MFTRPIYFEPFYPPEWDTDEMEDVEEEYEEVPRRLTPEGN